MPKKNYYELLGINPNITKEEIWEKVVDLDRKFTDENPANNKEEEVKRFQRFYSILGVLVNDEERARYDKHLTEFGDDENFQPKFDVDKTEDFYYFKSMTDQVFKKMEEEMRKLDFKEWNLFYENKKTLKKIVVLEEKWKCQFCQEPYEKLIIHSRIKPEPKLCLTCFAFMWGRHSSERGEELTGKYIDELVKTIKRVERDWSLSNNFELVSAY